MTGVDVVAYNAVTFDDLDPVTELPALCERVIDEGLDDDERQSALTVFLTRLDDYLPLPTLLDSVLPELVSSLTRASVISLESLEALAACEGTDLAVRGNAAHAPFSLLCALHKVRGKAAGRHYPHTADAFGRVLQLTLFASRHLHAVAYWRVRFVLWHWAANVCGMPFPLKALASQGDVNALADAALEAFSQSTAVAKAAATALARLTTRADASDLLQRAVSCCAGNVPSTGALTFLAVLFKVGRREVLLPHVDTVLDAAVQAADDTPNTRVLHLATKLAQRVALARLPTTRRTQYRRERRGLFGVPLEAKQADAAEERDIAMSEAGAECAERALGIVLMSLEHRDAVVRWSAAKGVGRLSLRLPVALTDDVQAHVMGALDSGLVESAHGACLALGELLRRALVRIERLRDLVPSIRAAACLDVRRDKHSVGDNVRDAACYVVWALARAYDADALRTVVGPLVHAMLRTALADREVHCRRAAAAALQELVGRAAAEDVPHGVFLVNQVQFFALSDRAAAFTRIAIDVAAVGDAVYFRTVLDAVAHQLRNWDPNVRALAADAIARLLPHDVKHVIVGELLPELAELAARNVDALHRHGAIVALSAALATGNVKRFAGERAHSLLQLPAALRDDGCFRGRSALLLQDVLCELIGALAQEAPAAFDERRLGEATSFLEGLVELASYALRNAASAFGSLAPLLAKHQHQSSLDALRLRMIKSLGEDGVHRARGFAAVAGHFSEHVGHAVLDAMIHAASRADDVEVRRNATRSLGMLCESASSIFDGARTKALGDALLCGMTDYTVDERGDVGSWVREAAMHSAVRLVRGVGVEDELLMDILGAIARQCVERIDRTRVVAGLALRALYVAVEKKPGKAAQVTGAVATILGVSSLKDDEHKMQITEAFASSSTIYHLGARLLDLPPVADAVLEGFVVSAGGMGHQSADATAALLSHAPSAQLVAALLPDQRLTVSALRTITALTRAGMMKGPVSDLAQLVRASWRGRMRNMSLVAAAIALLAELAVVTPSTPAPEALSALALVLGATIPRLRRIAADALYIALVERHHFAPSDMLQEALDTLADTPWSKLSAAQAREAREALCETMNLPSPVTSKVTGK